MNNGRSSLPPTASLGFDGNALPSTWPTTSTDPRALYADASASTRALGAWYTTTSFTAALNLADSRSHLLSLYLMDWDHRSRAETINLIDATSGLTLDSQSFSAFDNGTYATWNVSGSLTIQVVKTGGDNAVLNGLFLDPYAPARPAVTAATASSVSLAWPALAGANGYTVFRGPASGSSYTQVAVSSGTTYTDLTAAADTPYSYKVTATLSSGSTIPGPAVPAQTLSDPAAGADLLWADGQSPQVIDDYEPAGLNGLELGVRFTSDVPGTVTGVQFYKSNLNTGVHAGHLWDSSGNLLATATFTGESASGWQQVDFSSPVPIAAGQTYTASYFSTSGHYPLDQQYFSTNTDSPPLHAAASDNEVYQFGPSSFPTRVYNESNYWAQPVFVAGTAPSDLAASFVSGDEIDLSWTPDPAAVGDYEVDQWFPGTGWTAIDDVGGTASSYAVAGPFDPSTAYQFRLDAYDTSGNAAGLSNAAAVTTPAFPDAPSDLNALAVSDSQINLAWQDNSSNETGFKVERSADGVSWTLLTTTAANATTYSDTGLLENTGYSYRVTASNGAGDSASVTAYAYTPPKAPTGMTATFVFGGEIDLAWTDNSTKAAGYSVEQSADGSTWSQVASLGTTATSYTAAGPFNPSATYYFRVRAYAVGGGYSAYSNITNAATTAFPKAPSGLTATAVSTSQINLSWQDNSTNETGFTIQRSNDGSSWTAIATVGPNVTAYSDAGLSSGTVYYYRVSANNPAGSSSFTITAWAQTLYAVPTIATAATAGQSTVTGTTDTLSALGAIAGGQESSLIYYWSVTSGPDVTFSPNFGNAAKNTTVTFSAAGDYTLQVTIRNGSASVTSSVQVTVNQTLTSVVVTPSATSILPGATEQLTATGDDQFGAPMNTAPTFTWSIVSGGGSVDANGLFTAPSQNDTSTVQAAAGNDTGQVQIETSNASEGWYKVTLTGRTYEPGYDSGNSSGDLTVTNTDWILAASPEDAVRQAITGSVTLNTSYDHGHSTLTFPGDLGSDDGFGILGGTNEGASNHLTWDAANSRYTGAIGMWDGDSGAPRDWDFYWNVTVAVVTPTGTIGIVESDGSTELPHSENNSPGGYVLLNDDNDSYTFDSSGSPMSDINVTNIPTEIDLAPLKVHAVTTPSIGGTYTLSTSSSDIKLWMDETKATPVTPSTTFDATKDTTVYVEGVALSPARAAEQIVMKWSKSGISPITVDTADYTVFSIEGPQNVPGYTKYNYTADVPGSPIGGTDPWSLLLGTITAESAHADQITVGWGSGPTVATVRYTPAPGFRGERDVYVVQINLAMSGNTAQYASRTAAGPVQVDGAGTALIQASSASHAMQADVYISSIVGPTVDGQQRGLRFVQVGLVHQAQFRLKEGLFNNATPKVARVSSLQDGQVHFDALEQSTLPWVFQDAQSYLDITSDSTPITNVHFHAFDNPTIDATDLLTIGSSQVSAFAIDFRHWVYLGLRSTDPEAGNQVTERAVLNWDADMSGSIDVNGAYTPTGSGITGDGAFREITDGTIIPAAAPNINGLFASETWQTVNQ